MAVGTVSIPALFDLDETALYLRRQVRDVNLRDSYHEIDITIVANGLAAKREGLSFWHNYAALIALYFEFH